MFVYLSVLGWGLRYYPKKEETEKGDVDFEVED